jgi:hypothetical protein
LLRASRHLPLPASFACHLPRKRGRTNKQKRSRDASAPEFCDKCSPDGAKRNPETICELECRSRITLCSIRATKKKRKRNADRRMCPSSALARGARSADALACRRSTTALAVGAFARRAQLQARLPGTWQERIVLSSSPQPGGERLRAAKRALPAPACPSPGKAPPASAVVPKSMMPEAARERTVSFRARAPHSLRFREYPRPKASLDERDSRNVTEMGMFVKN